MVEVVGRMLRHPSCEHQNVAARVSRVGGHFLWIKVKHMQKELLHAIRQVLYEAGNAPHFFDFSDAERLNWMIARAFALGSERKAKKTTKEKGKSNDRG